MNKVVSEARFSSVHFQNYKALKRYSIKLSDFNVLVGPNNAGKSTIIGAFRILAEGIRRATARKPEYVDVRGIKGFAYAVNLEGIPVSTENVFSNYDDSEPAIVEFLISSQRKLRIL